MVSRQSHMLAVHIAMLMHMPNPPFSPNSHLRLQLGRACSDGTHYGFLQRVLLACTPRVHTGTPAFVNRPGMRMCKAGLWERGQSCNARHKQSFHPSSTTSKGWIQPGAPARMRPASQSPRIANASRVHFKKIECNTAPARIRPASHSSRTSVAKTHDCTQ